MQDLMQLEMPDGNVVWAVVEPARPGGDGRGPGDAGAGEDGPGPSDAGLGQDLVHRLHGLQECLQSVAGSVHEALTAVRPDEISVSFGVELAVGKHGVVAAIAGAGGKATLNVSLKWTPHPPTPAPVSTPPAPNAP